MEKRANGKGSEEGNGEKARWLELKEGPEWSDEEMAGPGQAQRFLAQGKGLAVVLPEDFEKGSDLTYIF